MNTAAAVAIASFAVSVMAILHRRRERLPLADFVSLGGVLAYLITYIGLSGPEEYEISRDVLMNTPWIADQAASRAQACGVLVASLFWTYAIVRPKRRGPDRVSQDMETSIVEPEREN
jgi:hypothetical protein